MRIFWFVLIWVMNSILVESYRTLASFSPNFPANTFTLGALSASTQISFHLNWTLLLSSPLTVSLAKVGNGTSCNSNSLASSPANFNFVVTEGGNYSIQVTTGESKPIPYTLVATIGAKTMTFTGVGTSYNFGKGIYFINIPSTCANAKIESTQASNYNYFNFFYPSDIPAVSNVDYGCFSQPSSSAISTIFNETGVYDMIPHSSITGLWVTATSTVHFRCYDPVCGDGIREGSQQCDNGNTTGCQDCIADPSYSCGSAIASPCSCWLPIFDYDTTDKQCVINCSLVSYATSLKSSTTNQCNCMPNFIFDETTYQCVVNCSAVAGSVGNANGSCACPQGFFYDEDIMSCVINCTTIPNAIGYDLSRNIDRCVCDCQFTFDISSLTCVMNQNVVPQVIAFEQKMEGLTPMQIGLIVGICLASVVAVAVGIMAALSWRAKTILNQSASCLQDSTKIVNAVDSGKNHEVITTQQN